MDFIHVMGSRDRIAAKCALEGYILTVGFAQLKEERTIHYKRSSSVSSHSISFNQEQSGGYSAWTNTAVVSCVRCCWDVQSDYRSWIDRYAR